MLNIFQKKNLQTNLLKKRAMKQNENKKNKKQEKNKSTLQNNGAFLNTEKYKKYKKPF